MASVHAPTPAAPPQFGLPRQHAVAVPDDDSDSESVAESSSRPAASGFLGGGGCGEEDDDDGCSSCVEGGDCGYQEADEEEGEGEVSTARVWWQKRLSASRDGDDGEFPPSEEAEDPERAAARQAEDRKFWEDCLGTGYP